MLETWAGSSVTTPAHVGQGRQPRKLPRSPQSSPYRAKACSHRGEQQKTQVETGWRVVRLRSRGPLPGEEAHEEISYPGRGGTTRKPCPKVQGQGLRSKPSRREAPAHILVPQPSPGQAGKCLSHSCPLPGRLIERSLQQEGWRDPTTRRLRAALPPSTHGCIALPEVSRWVTSWPVALVLTPLCCVNH